MHASVHLPARVQQQPAWKSEVQQGQANVFQHLTNVDRLGGPH
jgi:hypothetical protein